jgi:predicted nucleotidyltransferase
MPIPEPTHRLGYLPPGDYKATLAEVRARFASNNRRRELCAQLEYVVGELRLRGVKTIWIGGSFVTTKERPSDVDLIYETDPPGVSTVGWGELAETQRRQLKALRRVDLWKMPAIQPGKVKPLPFINIKQFFESDRDRRPAGLVLITEEEPHDH